MEGYLHFKDEPKVQKLRDDVLKYNRMVRDLGLRDHQVRTTPSTRALPSHRDLQVPTAQKASWKALGLLLYRLGLLFVWTMLALPGVILNGPIFLAASIMSRKKAKGMHCTLPASLGSLLTTVTEALAASTVKIAARDVLATWKVLISLGMTPLLYGFYAFLATLIVIRAGAPLQVQFWTPILIMVILPCIGYAALKFGEAGMDVLKSVISLYCLYVLLTNVSEGHCDHWS